VARFVAPSPSRNWPRRGGRFDLSFRSSAGAPSRQIAPAPAQSDPSGLETLYARGVALWNGGRRQEAIAALDAALRKNPEFPDALCMGGYILQQSGKREAALQFYRRALTLKVDLPDGWSNVGKLLFELDRFSEALDAFDAALALRPRDADLWNSRSGALRKLGLLDESDAAARTALELRPKFAEAALNLGTALLKRDRMEEALEAYQRASATQANYADALNGQGLALRALGRLEEARTAFVAAERLGSREAISGKGCLDLTLGDFEPGWDGYEARWVAGKSLAEALGVRYPKWRGPGRKGERVLVMNDHALGDTIQFCRYLPMMAAAGAQPTFLCPPRLFGLLSPLPGVRLLAEPPQGETFDAQIALSSLPRAFATRLESVPALVPYLTAQPERVRKWAARIGSDGFKIGVVWQGNPNPEADMARSAPLAAFAPLAATPGVRLIALQVGFGVEQLASLPAGMRVETLGSDFDAGPDAFLDTAAAMSQLDLIVTCDTSIAHLAGALARPAWVALKKDAEWRWLRDRDDSPWYPSLRLFRQRQSGEWSDVFATMAGELARLAPASSGSRMIAIPGAIGELIDKITILEIKARKIEDGEKARNVGRELALLQANQREARLDETRLAPLKAELVAVNEKLWDVEDDIRLCEKAGDFGARFVALARAVYVTNDRRAVIKREINTLFNSAIVEEKHYA
jgi:tetratricopeptide (TPR) repeat protein